MLSLVYLNNNYLPNINKIPRCVNIDYLNLISNEIFKFHKNNFDYVLNDVYNIVKIYITSHTQ